jgi:hypothetical protein
MNKNEYIQANGNKYYYSEKLSIERYIVYERLATQISTGMKAKDFLPILSDALKQLKSGNDLLGAHFGAIEKLQLIIHEGYKTYSPDHINDILMFCTLFLNREGEDAAAYDEEVMKSKIRDWIKEGIDIEFFFRFCRGLIPILVERYKADPQKDTFKNKSLRDFLLKENAPETSLGKE